MTVVINGTSGITDVNGSAAAPAITGTDTDTGVFFGTNTVSLSTGGTERLQVDSSGNLGLGVTPSVKLDVNGNALVRSGVLTLGTDTLYDAFVNSPESMYFNVDSDGNSTGNKFAWGTDRASNTGGTTWMTLDASGNLGVGTTSFSRRVNFAIADSTAYNSSSFEAAPLCTYIRNTDATIGSYAGLQFAVGSNGDAAIAGVRTADASCAITFGTRNVGSGSIVERARIDSSGNLLVNTSSSVASALGGGRLVVTGNAGLAGNFYQSSTSSSDYVLRVRHDNTTSGAYIQFVTDTNAETGRIYDSAGTMQYASSSDARLKDNVQPMQGGLSSVLTLKPCTYDMRRGEETVIASAGLIAQEVYDVYPYAVGVGGENENTHPWCVDYGKLTPLLISAIQEQQAIITQLQADVAALKGNA